MTSRIDWMPMWMKPTSMMKSSIPCAFSRTIGSRLVWLFPNFILPTLLPAISLGTALTCYGLTLPKFHQNSSQCTSQNYWTNSLSGCNIRECSSLSMIYLCFFSPLSSSPPLSFSFGRLPLGGVGLNSHFKKLSRGTFIFPKYAGMISRTCWRFMRDTLFWVNSRTYQDRRWI